ncbi:MAG TPA: type III polyketide synthase [Chitinophagaceae bacterium]|nr:type III polyketide synthase [Chitinophagaceae bacterium]
MSKIISIGTALPSYRHEQKDIQRFMELVFALDNTEKRKLKFLYQHSGIGQRYSVIRDYSREINDWTFYPQSENLEPFPTLEQRMDLFNKYAGNLSVDAIRDSIGGIIEAKDITHLVTVSCTGMSAPGIDLQVVELMELPKNIYRTSVNFMGCYAALHALKIGDAICKAEQNAKVVIVCTELCTLHFQKEPSIDNITSSLLFGDGAAAVLMAHDDHPKKGLKLDHFYSEVMTKGRKDMAWELSSSGFLMTLSGYVPELLEEDFSPLVTRALEKAGINKEAITHWCIHPGGKRILDAIHKSLGLSNGQLDDCYAVLKDYGNMSSATILFVLKKIMQHAACEKEKIFGAAFGPGLTMETFVASVD